MQHRVLQSSVCGNVRAVSTVLNELEDIPTYYGIMFEVLPLSDLELLTLEFGIRIPSVEADNPDLSVEIFSLVGSYELLKAYKSDRWTKVIETQAVPLPAGSGTAIIPAVKFPKIKLKRNQRRSFYISMKRPYLNVHAEALDKTGETAAETDQLKVMVGVGYNAYNFPGEFDNRLDPQFSGTLFFKGSPENCNLQMESTSVEYSFLFGQKTDVKFMLKVDEIINRAIPKLVESSATLKDYAKRFSLKISRDTESRQKDYDSTSSIVPDFILL